MILAGRNLLNAAAASVAALALAACGGGGGDDPAPVVVAPDGPVAPGSDPVAPTAPPPAGGNGPPLVKVDATATCARLEGRTIANAQVTAVAVVPAGGAAATHCRVLARMDPNLNFAIRLPENWNGKLFYGGGSGYGGSIPDLSYVKLAALQQGYATVGSDTGHQGSHVDAAFALDDPVAADLFGSLSVPTVMTPAVSMLETAYGQPPSRRYFEGCSNGGREALMMAQRYPGLFDGVIARAPAYNWTGWLGAANRNVRALAAPGGQLGPAKVGLLAAAVRSACDASDGLLDGIVSNPAACTLQSFDPRSLRCPGGGDTGDACLSDAQLAFVESWTTSAEFGGVPRYRNAGWQLTGNEDDPGAWPAWITGNGNYASSLQFLFQETTVRNYLARDPSIDSLAYGAWDRDPAALSALASRNDATDPDLRPFQAAGGKLILWHGANDAAVSARATTEYYEAVVSAVGGPVAADPLVRYYVAPGVNHCGLGRGADEVDLLGALDAWVDRGTAPGTLIARRQAAGATQFTRPLCRYPAYPHYVGPADDPESARSASSFTCVVP